MSNPACWVCAGHFLHEPARTWLADGTLDWLWSGAEAAGVPIAMLATDSLKEIGEIAERHPGLRLTIDHLGGRGGNTTLKDDASMVHMPQLLALAKYPNIAVKATGAPGYSSEDYPFPTMHRYLQQIYDAFGPRRMFWGTDISKMPVSWGECISMFTEELSFVSKQDLPLIMVRRSAIGGVGIELPTRSFRASQSSPLFSMIINIPRRYDLEGAPG